jgi:xylulose-5-phosphate/fructose-6-phosphate phosphoketolase
MRLTSSSPFTDSPGGAPVLHGRPDARFHVRGFIEHGTTPPPFDMTVKNNVSRYHLVADAIHNARRTPPGSTDLLTWCQAKLAEHDAYMVEHLEDMPDVMGWTLPARS